MTKAELRQEIFETLKGMYWVPQDPDKWSDAADVEADTLMEKIKQYAREGSQEENARR